MFIRQGKYEAAPVNRSFRIPVAALPISFFLIELFAFQFLDAATQAASSADWPLAFGGLWAMLLTGLVRLLPRLASRILFGMSYFLSVSYAAIQTGYFLLFREMMWLSDFRYASEGSDYFDILLTYPLSWWLGILGLLILGIFLLWKYPAAEKCPVRKGFAALAAAAGICGVLVLPEFVFQYDKKIQYAGSDYGRAQSAEAAYENMFNAHRLYQVCGIFQTAVKDLYTNYIYPITPGYLLEQHSGQEEIDAYFAAREAAGENEMTGLLKDKNVILVLMESMDDWMIGEHTPTIQRLMQEGIRFTRSGQGFRR